MADKLFLKKGKFLYCKEGHKIASITRDVKYGDPSYISALDFKFGTEPPKTGENVHYNAEKFPCKKCGAQWFFIAEGAMNFYRIKMQ